jgi:hypothetical protein
VNIFLNWWIGEISKSFIFYQSTIAFITRLKKRPGSVPLTPKEQYRDSTLACPVDFFYEITTVLSESWTSTDIFQQRN